MARMTMESHTNDVHVHLDVEAAGPAEAAFNSHLLRDALAHLIEEAPVDFWIKDPGELKPEAFWAALLGAVARSYRVSVAEIEPIDETVGDAAVLRDLLDHLEAEEYL